MSIFHFSNLQNWNSFSMFTKNDEIISQHFFDSYLNLTIISLEPIFKLLKFCFWSLWSRCHKRNWGQFIAQRNPSSHGLDSQFTVSWVSILSLKLVSKPESSYYKYSVEIINKSAVGCCDKTVK